MHEIALLTFIKDWLWAPFLAGLAWAWTFINGRITNVEAAAKAHGEAAKRHADERFSVLNIEVTRQRDVSAKIFDTLTEMRKESAERHERLLIALHEGLESKADK